MARSGLSTREAPDFAKIDSDLEGRGAGGIVITAEDHYAHGGLGDAVLWAFAEERVRAYKLAVREIPHGGKPAELIAKFGISTDHIVNAVKSALG